MPLIVLHFKAFLELARINVTEKCEIAPIFFLHCTALAKIYFSRVCSKLRRNSFECGGTGLRMSHGVKLDYDSPDDSPRPIRYFSPIFSDEKFTSNGCFPVDRRMIRAKRLRTLPSPISIRV